MTRTKKTSIAFLFGALFSTLAFMFLEKQFSLFGDMDYESLHFLFFILIIIALGTYKIRKKDKLLKRADDEMSIHNKYKASYYAYESTLSIWLFIFILSRHFPNAMSMLGTGIFLTVAFGVIAKIVANREINEE
jgi:asparagine N-glycosylation enzyme membrane subunit Stt3